MAERASAQVRKLGRSPSILEELDRDLTAAGIVGEERAKKLLYLALTSRLGDRPVSLALTGVTGTGKSVVMKAILPLLPRGSYVESSSSSAQALAFRKGDYVHKFIVFHEGAGILHEQTMTTLKNLVSDALFVHRTTENIKGRFEPRLIRKHGPTGLLFTTTRQTLEPEIESRLISLPMTESPDQTRAILLATAERGGKPPRLDAKDAERWLQFQ